MGAAAGSIMVQHAHLPRPSAEVYAVARTSGYPHGRLAEAPGLEGVWRREWTVGPDGPVEEEAVGQLRELRSWNNRGTRVEGDSGAWLM